MKETSINSNQSLVAYNQAAKIRQPCEGSFNYPSSAIALEFSSILHFYLFLVAPMRCNQINHELFKSLAKRIAVIALISYQAKRALLWTSLAVTRYLYAFKRNFRKFDFCGRCRGKGASDRNTLAVDHHHPTFRLDSGSCGLCIFHCAPFMKRVTWPYKSI